MTVVYSILLGLCLSAMAGLRVFVPLLGLSVAVRYCGVQANEAYAWIGGDLAFYTLLAASVVEALAYLIPFVDHLLDVALVWIVPVVGTFLALAVIPEQDPFLEWATAIIAGGGLALGVRATASGLRTVSTATTAGLANPLFSALESLISVIGTILAIVVPLVCALMLVLFFWICVRLWRRLRGRERLQTS